MSDVIIGGETPFFSPSEALLHAPEKPTRFSKDGVDHTRLLNLGLLAAACDAETLESGVSARNHPAQLRKVEE